MADKDLLHELCGYPAVKTSYEKLSKVCEWTVFETNRLVNCVKELSRSTVGCEILETYGISTGRKHVNGLADWVDDLLTTALKRVSTDANRSDGERLAASFAEELDTMTQSIMDFEYGPIHIDLYDLWHALWDKVRSLPEDDENYVSLREMALNLEAILDSDWATALG